MAFRTQKISQMTPKGANLEATDLIEVSTIESGSYVTRSITGQEIIDAVSGSGVTSVTGTSPISSSGGATPAISIATANTTTTGALTSTDWNTFNNKQDALVSGTNIKTIEGQSLLGSGNIDLTKSDVGLGNVDNTSDLNKPISTATQTALNAKENTITAGTTSQYFRGDKTFQTLDKTAVGLANVDNTSDANKPISTATQTALNAKQNTLTLTTTGTSGAATLVGSTLNIPQYSGGGGSSPITNLGIGTTGTAVTGTTANTITQSVLIPANTLAANNTLDFIARFSKTGNAGAGTYRVYINTSNSLTGATLFANLYAVSGGAVIPTHQNQRTFFYDGVTLSSNAGGTSNVTDISQFTVAGYTMIYNSATAYYLIFTIQLTNIADSSVINGFRVLKYA